MSLSGSHLTSAATDMPMKVPPDQVLTAFNSLSPNASVDDLLNFTNTYFYPSGAFLRILDPAVVPLMGSPQATKCGVSFRTTGRPRHRSSTRLPTRRCAPGPPWCTASGGTSSASSPRTPAAASTATRPSRSHICRLHSCLLRLSGRGLFA